MESIQLIDGDTRLSLPIKFETVKEVVGEDGRFLNVYIDVLHTGLNFNKAIFSQEVVDENVETIKNTPIVGFIEVKSDKDFKGHEYVLTKTENGIERKYVGHAYGIVPESCNPRWIEKECSDGKVHTFLRVDGLLWTKFKDSVDIITRDIEKGHSMELYPKNIEGYEDEDGNFVFTKFSFDGCCILGNTKEPAMIDSVISVNFTVRDFIYQMQNEINDKYTIFTKIKLSKNNVDNNLDESLNNKNSKEGGSVNMITNFSQTVMQQFSDISNIVSTQELIKDKWGDDFSRYEAIDIKGNLVIIVDKGDNYNYYACEFTVEGDKPVVNFETKKRMKIDWIEYEENAQVLDGAFNFGTYISQIENKTIEKIEEANSKVIEAEKGKATAEANYATLESQYNDIKPKYDEYVKTENERIEKENKENKDNLIAQYEVVLKDNEEFVELKEHLSDYSVEDIEQKCALMYARKSIAMNFSKNNRHNSTVLDAVPDEGNHSGCMYTKKYGWIRRSK